MVKPSSMGAIYTDTSAYRRNNRIDSVVKQLSDEMNTVV
jgi:predicted transcriptional regulator